MASFASAPSMKSCDTTRTVSCQTVSSGSSAGISPSRYASSSILARDAASAASASSALGSKPVGATVVDSIGPSPASTTRSGSGNGSVGGSQLANAAFAATAAGFAADFATAPTAAPTAPTAASAAAVAARFAFRVRSSSINSCSPRPRSSSSTNGSTSSSRASW